jgi:hypothetical protein
MRRHEIRQAEGANSTSCAEKLPGATCICKQRSAAESRAMSGVQPLVEYVILGIALFNLPV